NQGFVGPFANHSHYAQYMNMTIGAAIGLVCMDLYEKFSGVKRTPNEILKYLFSGNSKRLWLLFGIMAVSSATVFVSLSRGGMIGMLTAFSIIALLMFRRGRLNMDSFSIALTGLAAFSIVLFLGFEAVYDRFGSIFDISQYHWRAQILKDMAGSFKQFPLWGTGQGTHSVIYPLFQRIATALEFTHAENEYAQVLEETGILGLGVLIAFAAVILKKVVGLFRARNNSACVAAYGMAFGLIAILIHSLSDFGQHVPANAVLSIVFAAIIVALARKVKETEPKPARLKIIGVASFRTVVLATAVGIFALLLISADKARVSDKYWKQVLAIEDTLTKDRWKANERAYEDIIRLATVSRDGQKDNARYRHWYNVYRLQELKSRCDLNEYGLSEAVQSTVNSIVDDLNGARLDCPTYAPLYCLIGRIEIFYLNKDSGLEKIKKAYELHRNDPVICFNRGLVDLIESNQEASIDKFKRAMKLNPGLVHEVANELICDFSLPLLAVDSTDNDPKLLSVTIKKLKEMEYYDIADSARAKMQQLLEAKCSLSKVAPGMRIMLGDIYREKEMTSKAIECYELALDADFAQVQWRYTLAELLIEQGRYPEAMAKAKMCLKFQPQFQPARQLVMDLAMMKETFQPDGTVKW
ncbi:MAG: O-antigen ligase family protein, partial [Anaerohalosphaera sp.]|nr:O-antigen ligase family protein [Anaerohalosphaera sp.]